MADVDARVIADLCRERWAIETFFKWIKQNLKIKTYLGTDLNAVLVQMWIAMIAYLLVHLIHRSAPKDAITAQRLLLVFIAIRCLTDVSLTQAWQAFQRPKRKQSNPLKNQPRKVT